MTIQIHTLWGTRKGYENDVPELMVAWDEYAVDANPNGFVLACQTERDAWGSDLVAERFIMIDLPRDQIMHAFLPITIVAQVPEDTSRRLALLGHQLSAEPAYLSTSGMKDQQAAGKSNEDPKRDSSEAHPTGVEASPLGSMVEQLRVWRAAGVTKESLGYAVGQVWWD